VYSSLSHYLFEKITEDSAQPSEFHVFSIYSWIQLAAIISSFLALSISIYLFLTTKAFLAMAVIPHRVLAVLDRPRYVAKRTEPSPLVYTQRSTPSMLPYNDSKIISYTEIIDHVESFISADVLLSFIAVILIILLLAKFCKNRKCAQRARETEIFLEIGCSNQAVRYHWQTLAYPIANYILKISRPTASIRVSNHYFLSRIRLNIGSISLSHKQLGTVIAVTRTSQYICKYNTRKLNMIMDNDYYIALIMISGNDAMSIALLRSLNLVGELSGQEATEEPIPATVQMSPPGYIEPRYMQLLTAV